MSDRNMRSFALHFPSAVMMAFRWWFSGTHRFGVGLGISVTMWWVILSFHGENRSLFSAKYSGFSLPECVRVLSTSTKRSMTGSRMFNRSSSMSSSLLNRKVSIFMCSPCVLRLGRIGVGYRFLAILGIDCCIRIRGGLMLVLLRLFLFLLGLRGLFLCTLWVCVFGLCFLRLVG